MTYRVVVRDPNLVELGPLPYLSLTMLGKFCDLGTWSLTVDGKSPAVDLLESGGGVVIYKEGNPVPFFSGPWIGSLREGTKDNDVETLTLWGYDDNMWLAIRDIYPDPTQPVYNQVADAQYVATGSLERVSRNIVRLNAASGAISSRRVFGLSAGSVPVSGGLGPNVPVSYRFDNMLEALTALYAHTGYGFRVVQQGTSLLFQVYGVTDRSAQVTLSRGRGNLSAYRLQTTAPSVNAAAVAGQGEGTARNIREVVDLDSIADWWRVESFIDRRDTNDNPTLIEAGAQALVDGATATSLSITPIDVDGMEYGVEYGLGDTIGIEINSILVSDVVRQVQITSKGGEADTVTPLVGSDNATFPRLPRHWSRIKKLTTRVGLLEKRL